MTDIKVGDRVKINDRPDWYVPSGYRLASAEGKVVEVVQEPQGYLMILLDEELTGIDPQVPLGFRIEAVEKI